MTREPRNRILAEFNHIMLRGIGHIDLFMDEDDHLRFMDTIKRFNEGREITIHAFCLMNNHVHMLVQAPPDAIPGFMKSIEVSYAQYFNSAHEHVGHLFQNRYKSEAITSERYFLAAFRYILLNPQAAGICRWVEYQWSSSKTYLMQDDDGITDTSLVTDIIGGRDEVVDFVNRNAEDSSKIAEPVLHGRRLRDNEALMIIQAISGLKDPLLIQGLDQEARNELLAILKKKGITIRQLERMTGINRNTIQRAKRVKGESGGYV